MPVLCGEPGTFSAVPAVALYGDSLHRLGDERCMGTVYIGLEKRERERDYKGQIFSFAFPVCSHMSCDVLTRSA